MFLYYAPGACSLASHIALIEAELPHHLIRVGRDKQTADGRDFRAVNPKGYTPALQLDDGALLTENLAILAYVAERSGRFDGAAPLWRALEALSFLTTEIHGDFRPFFFNAPEPQKQTSRARLIKHFGLLAEQLDGGRFLFGDRISIADPYLFVMLNWAAMFGLETPARLVDYHDRMKTWPSVETAVNREQV